MSGIASSTRIYRRNGKPLAPANDGKTYTMSVVVSGPTKRFLNELADKSGHTLSHETERMIERGIMLERLLEYFERGIE